MSERDEWIKSASPEYASLALSIRDMIVSLGYHCGTSLECEGGVTLGVGLTIRDRLGRCIGVATVDEHGLTYGNADWAAKGIDLTDTLCDQTRP
ncbi:hypothetical protein [Albimonas pacifica]|uniref:Uncharacterized protein n=1 Tax=Albimonas pacifica TaxID=1114924 RepID=A0A1I3LKC7_9RHOB|nr:hypothetical protein [Albimonas pacifica]SFI84925.1 hypothetical protein SAMN05216258_11062 [Albimonas pacifica]